VSYRLSGVNDTAQAASAVPLTQLRQPQRCHWHRSGTDFVEQLREFEAIFENALTRELFDEKTSDRKSRDTVSLTCPEPFLSFDMYRGTNICGELGFACEVNF
jgi:hypothetical protein